VSRILKGHFSRPDDPDFSVNAVSLNDKVSLAPPPPALQRHERLTRIEGLHRIACIHPEVPVRIYAGAPLTELPATLFPHLLSGAEWMQFHSGDQVVSPESRTYTHIAVVSGELEIIGSSAAVESGRLLNCALEPAIVLLHSIPRGVTVRALTESRVIRLDSGRVEALRGWMLRCDSRRRPSRRLPSSVF